MVAGAFDGGRADTVGRVLEIWRDNRALVNSPSLVLEHYLGHFGH